MSLGNILEPTVGEDSRPVIFIFSVQSRETSPRTHHGYRDPPSDCPRRGCCSSLSRTPTHAQHLLLRPNLLLLQEVYLQSPGLPLSVCLSDCRRSSSHQGRSSTTFPGVGGNCHPPGSPCRQAQGRARRPRARQAPPDKGKAQEPPALGCKALTALAVVMCQQGP